MHMVGAFFTLAGLLSSTRMRRSLPSKHSYFLVCTKRDNRRSCVDQGAVKTEEGRGFHVVNGPRTNQLLAKNS
jgi:hypothetical protein